MENSASAIIYTPLFEIVYARAFFLTSPSERPLVPGETRLYPAKYTIGAHDKATAYHLDWYADQMDADARGLDNLGSKLTDSARLPTATFLPLIPNPDARPDELQDVSVTLTAPAASANPYENPVPVIEMTQETLTIAPHLYLLGDAIEISDRITDYRFRYRAGGPALTAFTVEWYATRLDARLMVNRLTDTERLPTARFIPEIPNPNAGAGEFQDGIVRLFPSTHEMPYTNAIGLLCMEQCPVKAGDPKTNPVDPIDSPRRHHRPTWEIYRTPTTKR